MSDDEGGRAHHLRGTPRKPTQEPPGAFRSFVSKLFRLLGGEVIEECAGLLAAFVRSKKEDLNKTSALRRSEAASHDLDTADKRAKQSALAAATFAKYEELEAAKEREPAPNREAAATRVIELRDALRREGGELQQLPNILGPDQSRPATDRVDEAAS